MAACEEPCGCNAQEVTCASVTCQYADVSLPLKLRPHASLGTLQTECCGEPVLALRCCANGGCEITITQTVCMRIPVCYGATADAGDVTVSCKRVGSCH